MSRVAGHATTSVKHKPSFDEVNAAALAAYPGLLTRWFPKGRLHGHEFRVGNLQGDPGESLGVNVNTGVWSDFADDHGGNDPISLYAALNGLKQGDAKNRLAEELGLAVPNNHTPKSCERQQSAKSQANGTKPGCPPPDRHPELGEPSLWHEYTDADGTLIFYHCRFDPPGRKKEFRPLTRINGQWRWKDGWPLNVKRPSL